jgi:hypothetical protein
VSQAHADTQTAHFPVNGSDSQTLGFSSYVGLPNAQTFINQQPVMASWELSAISGGCAGDRQLLLQPSLNVPPVRWFRELGSILAVPLVCTPGLLEEVITPRRRFAQEFCVALTLGTGSSLLCM